jgi:hypothetical protein
MARKKKVDFLQLCATEATVDALPLAAAVEEFVDKLTTMFRSGTFPLVYDNEADAIHVARLLSKMEEESNRILFNTRIKDHAG